MQGEYSQNYWVCASPFLSSSLFLQSIHDESSETVTAVQFFDCDGALFNELKVDFGSNPVGLLDLEPFLAECKFESGMKYCRLKVIASKPPASVLRLQSRDWTVVCDSARHFSATEKYLVTVEQDLNKSTWIVVLNDNNVELDIRARLFLAKRSPEVELKVPALGARVFDCKTLFPDIFNGNVEMAQAYIRVSTVGSAVGYIQTLGIPVNPKQPRVFSVLV